MAHTLSFGRISPVASLTPIGVAAGVIALATTVISLAQIALLEPLGFPRSDQLVVLGRTRPVAPAMFGASLPDYLDWHEWTRRWTADMGAYDVEFLAVDVDGRAVEAEVARATPSLWSTLQTTAVRGRLFDISDSEVPKPRVAVISERLWRSAFQGLDATIGRRLQVLGPASSAAGQFEIVGVLPASARLRFPDGPDVFLPLSTAGVSQAGFENPLRRVAGYQVIARLRDGVEFDALATAVGGLHPTDFHDGTTSDRLAARSLADHVLGNSRDVVRALAVATGVAAR